MFSFTLLCSSLLGLSLGARYYGTVELSSSNDMDLGVLIDDTNDYVTIGMTYASSYWSGVGFGSTTMSGTYTIVNLGDSGEAGLERDLGNHAAGTLLGSEITVLSDETSSGIRTVVLRRALDVGNSSYYSFEGIGDGDSIDLIWGYGNTATFSRHESRGVTSISFDTCSDEPTAAPTPMPTASSNDTASSSASYTCTVDASSSSPAPVLVQSLFAGLLTVIAAILLS